MIVINLRDLFVAIGLINLSLLMAYGVRSILDSSMPGKSRVLGGIVMVLSQVPILMILSDEDFVAYLKSSGYLGVVIITMIIITSLIYFMSTFVSYRYHLVVAKEEEMQVMFHIFTIINSIIFVGVISGIIILTTRL